MQIVESLAQLCPLEVILRLSLVTNELNQGINSRHVLGLICNRYKIKELNNLSELTSYESAINKDVPEALAFLLPKVVPRNLLPSLLGLSCKRGSYKVAANLVPRCIEEIYTINLHQSEFNTSRADEYLCLFMRELWETCDLLVYKTFIENVDKILSTMLRWFGTKYKPFMKEFLTHSYALYEHTGDNALLEYLLNYECVDNDRVSFWYEHRCSISGPFVWWMYKKGWANVDDILMVDPWRPSGNHLEVNDEIKDFTEMDKIREELLLKTINLKE